MATEFSYDPHKVSVAGFIDSEITCAWSNKYNACFCTNSPGKFWGNGLVFTWAPEEVCSDGD